MKEKIYSFIRRFLPKRARGHVTLSLFKLGLKPTVHEYASPYRRGIVVMSADFEMAWAFRYSKQRSQHAVEIGLQERKNVPVILNLLDTYQIPCTWSTVGHLMLDSCRKTNGSIHSDMPRPAYFENKNWCFHSGDWYQHDPGSDYQKDPAWYAPDLVEQIIQAQVSHEIGCHTFSHIDFTNEHCPPDLARAEISRCKELAARMGIQLRSMVFPGGTEGNRQVLKEQGFWCYRKPMDFEIDMPYVDEYGLVAIPSSYGMEKPSYNWSAKTCFEIVKSYLDKAAATRKVCHLWFHPSMHPWYLEKVFPRILKYIDEQRMVGLIDVYTMSDLASNILDDYGIFTDMGIHEAPLF